MTKKKSFIRFRPDKKGWRTGCRSAANGPGLPPVKKTIFKCFIPRVEGWAQVCPVSLSLYMVELNLHLGKKSPMYLKGFKGNPSEREDSVCGLPPCIFKFRSTPFLLQIQFLFFYKTSYLDVEINGTQLSPSVSVPW
jgi:hypothetical protein